MAFTEEDGVLEGGKHVVVGFGVKQFADFHFLVTMARARAVGSMAYYVCEVDPDSLILNIGFPVMDFEYQRAGGGGMVAYVQSLGALVDGDLGGIGLNKVKDTYFPPEVLRLCNGPTCGVKDVWLPYRAESLSKHVAFYEDSNVFWQGGDFFSAKDDVPEQPWPSECIEQVWYAVRECVGKKPLLPDVVVQPAPELALDLIKAKLREGVGLADSELLRLYRDCSIEEVERLARSSDERYLSSVT